MANSKKKSAGTSQNRYEQIFAERNRALRLLFDTTISIVNDGVLPGLVSQKLIEITDGDYCSFAYYNKAESTLEVKAVVGIDGLIEYPEDITVAVSHENYNLLSKKNIEYINEDKVYLNPLLPVKWDKEKNLRSCIPCVSDKKLIGVCILQMPVNKKIKLKDIIEILMNICGIEIQRKKNYEELLISRQQLLQSEEAIRNIFETCGVPMCAIDTDYNVIKCNRHFLSLWQVTPEQLETMKCYEICGGESCQTDKCFLESVLNKMLIEREVTKKNPAGGELIMNVVATPLVEHGKIVGAIEAMHDITESTKMKKDIEKSNKKLQAKTNELKATQKKLVESTNLSALSTLSTGIAHEFNNILTIMSGYIEILNSSLNDDSYASIITTMNQVTDRAKQITAGLLEFSQHLSTKNKLSADIKTVLDNAIMLSNKTLIDAKIDVSRSFDDIPSTYCFSSQLTQVFLSIITNAIEAMEQSAKKKLDMHISFCKNTICVKKGLSCDHSDGCIIIDIIDSGKGIAKEDQKKIFEPFYTTKGVLGEGKVSKSGTGLGLSISYGIIKRHDGSINVKSKPDEGTKITITLPVDRQGYIDIEAEQCL